MISTLLQPEDIRYVHYNERDIEIPSLIGLVSAHHPKSFLDVGARYSYHYAMEVRPLVQRYTAVDILPCLETEAIVDRYYTDDICSVDLEPHDFVSCISTIEHSGITTYQVNDCRLEQIRVFSKLLSLTKHTLFLTFPFGLNEVFPNQYAQIYKDLLACWIDMAYYQGFQYDAGFWFNEFPQGKELWRIVNIEFASQVPIRAKKGTQCICLMEIFK